MPKGFLPPEKPGPKILTLDIETAPMEGWFWGLFDQRVGLNQIKKDWYILSYGAKWLTSSVAFYEDVFEVPNYEDGALIANLWRLLDAADIVVTQNGKRFDTRKINARFLNLGMPPPRPYKQVDTKVEAQRLAMNTSNKLEYLAQAVAGTHKKKHERFPGFVLWKEWLDGNRKARDEMRTYCIQDVKATEALYLELRPWVVGHPNVAMYYDDTLMRCPKCGSTELSDVGKVYTQVGSYVQYRCSSCGGFARSRYSKVAKEKGRNLLVC